MLRPSPYYLLICLGFTWITTAGCINANAADEMSTVKSDERVVFFPTVSRLSEDGREWVIPIHGWIFEPEEDDIRRAALVYSIQKALALKPDELHSRIFRERIRLFLVDNERGKRVGIRIAGQEHVLEPSDPDGHFFATVRLPVELVQRNLADGILPYEAILDPSDKRTFQGTTQCVQPEGVSVISDIDDTIKVTEVGDKRKMLLNTFFREFRPVEGMPELYARWAKDGTRFHFVSASPWQLYEPLDAFATKNKFPVASFHLKRIRLKDSSLARLFEDPIKYKVSIIERLIESFPKRTFILVGDSGEKDPETYGILARRYPTQIKRIYIRDVTDEPQDSDRYREAFRDIPVERWQVFRDPAELEGIEKE